MSRALVIIPTYNERENLPRLVPAVLGAGSLPGDPGGRRQLPRRRPAPSPTRSPPRSPASTSSTGKGSSASEPPTSPASAGASSAATTSSSRWTPTSPTIPPTSREFLAAANDFGYDVVLGSRYLQGRVTVVNWPIGRLLLSYFANVYARWVTGLPVADATGGFKCFRRQVLAAIDLSRVESNGYSFQIEMSFRAWKKGFRLGEIPIIFVDRDVGESKMSKKIVREAVWRVWRLRLLSLFGRL